MNRAEFRATKNPFQMIEGIETSIQAKLISVLEGAIRMNGFRLKVCDYTW